MQQPKTVVYDLLTTYTSKPADQLRPGDRLVSDLKLDGDDYAFGIVATLKRRFGILPVVTDWESVHTVADLVQLVEEHVQKQRTKAF